MRVLTVNKGGPADRAGLRPHDLIVAAAGRRINFLKELTAILGSLNPGDRLSLEVVRGIRPLRLEVVAAAPPPPRANGPSRHAASHRSGAGPSESIPPPPGEIAAPGRSSAGEGPALAVPVPQPIAPSNPQAEIDELRRRVEQLERKVRELEQALSESQRK